MLTQDDRNAIDGLFDRLETVSRQYPDRDAEAEALLAEHLRRAPAAPYYMAQTLVMQEHALAEAQRRIAELESQATERPAGGLFGGLFGGGNNRPPAPVHPASRPAAQQQAQARQGGFLAGAAQTALGVTGGVLLGSAIAGMLSPDQAMADEPPADEPPADDFGDFGGDDDMGF